MSIVNIQQLANKYNLTVSNELQGAHGIIFNDFTATIKIRWKKERNNLLNAGCYIAFDGDIMGIVKFDPNSEEQVEAVLKAIACQYALPLS